MSGDAFRKVTPGERFKMPAQFFNTMVDLANERNRNRNQSSEAGIYGEYDPAWICVKNTSGAAIGSGCPVKLGSTIVLPDSTSPTKDYAVECGAPDSTAITARKIFITHGPINDGMIGWAISGGVCIAYVSVGSTSHTHAYATASDATKLTSGNAGQYRLIYAPATGNKYCLVEREPSPTGVFPVKVTKTGGSDGSQSSAASWTYTVKDLSDVELGTSVALSRTRPAGKMTYGSSYGLAFYDGATLKLWDAGEYPGSGGC